VLTNTVPVSFSLPPIAEALEEVKQGTYGYVEAARTGQRDKKRRYWVEDKAGGFGV
jgi:hypothetical protein